MELYEVIKPLQGDRLYRPGEIVDGGSWRHRELLVAQGRIRRHIPQPAETVEPQPRRSRHA